MYQDRGSETKIGTDPSQYKILNDRAFSTSNIMRPALNSLQKHGLHQVDYLKTQLSSENFNFKSQLTSLYMI